MAVVEDLFVNGTHFGYGDDYVFSTTSSFAFALYASVVISILVIAWSFWIYCACGARDIQDDTKKEVLLETNPYARIDELLEQFHREVQQSEVLVYDEEEHGDRPNPFDLQRQPDPPVVNGFYSLTQDDPSLEYNEDMYFEFIPTNRNDSNGCNIHGYGKYDTGNVRVEGFVASTGEAYWYEVPYEESNAPPVVLARGTFARHESSGGICFTGQWYHSNGEKGGTYSLFSHKVAFANSTCPSVAESMTVMECSFTGSVLGDDTIEGSLDECALDDIEGAIDLLEDDAALECHEDDAAVDPPTVVVLSEGSSETRVSEETSEVEHSEACGSFQSSSSSSDESYTLDASSLV